MKKYNNYDLHFRFETKDNIDFLNAEFIHPLKQELVQTYVGCFKEDENIRAVIIFGSGVEFGCHSYSDLDMCIERFDEQKGFRNYPDNYLEETDIVYADVLGERLKKEIEEKGIVVYDKEGLYV